MAEFMKVCTTGDVAPGTMKKFSAEGYDVLVANIDGNFFAIDNHCPHMGGDLSAGKLEGSVVTCPRHSSQFDVKDGKFIRWAQMGPVISTIARMIKPPRPVYTYKVKMEGGAILVEKPPPFK
jgi:3-phenylpropionate/trans-cinnamate dioxygenase ferredoxin component